MHCTPRRAFVPLGLLTISILGAFSCVLSPLESQNETHRYPAFGLEEVRPVDIALLPIRDLTGTGEVPVRILRQALYDGLARRLYSPISLKFVDVNWVESGFDADSLEADGVLQITVDEWDTDLLATHGAIRVVIQAELLDGVSKGAEPLWGARLKRRLELVQGIATLSREELFERAARLIAREVLAQIPERDPGVR